PEQGPGGITGFYWGHGIGALWGRGPWGRPQYPLGQRPVRTQCTGLCPVFDPGQKVGGKIPAIDPDEMALYPSRPDDLTADPSGILGDPMDWYALVGLWYRALCNCLHHIFGLSVQYFRLGPT